MLKQYRNIHTDDVRAHAWSDVAAKAQTYGDQMVNRWSREIKTYLIFAGLFSAILTPFNVESYKMLQPGGRDSTGQTLERISLQLHSFSISYPFVNSTQPGSPFVRDAGNGSQTVAQSAIWLNSLWFSALILSLTSALVSIIASQWLSEYRAVCGTSHDIARLRQYRAENLEDWHVGEIVLIIPVLLVLSLGLFFSGLLVLLWTLHPSVAIVASVLIVIAVAFTLVVAVLPVFSVSCAYLSPQARIMYAFWQHLLSPIVTFFRYFIFLYLISVIYDTISSTDSWLSDYLLRLLTDEGRNKLKALSWAQREESEIHVARYKLDVNVLTKAWESTLDQEAVSFATICLLLKIAL
ncbi:hypothetical protein BC628DRAFT_794757 [Trametes gibbosa]|nr:hypothetical protein BC628DRAFT_794757 [Trametes gibbosa]